MCVFRLTLENNPLDQVTSRTRYVSQKVHILGAIKSKKKDANSSSKLPILLKPTVVGDDLPSFEVEESSDGRLTLLPIGPKASNAKGLFTKKKNAVVPLDFAQFESTVSAGYFAILHVFKYLGTKDRLSASKVCKLWHQISRHPSLWTNVNLKNCRIQNWTSLRDLFNRLGTKKLDFSGCNFNLMAYKLLAVTKRAAAYFNVGL